MALQTCVDCGREVSTRAVACPQCGAPIQAALATGSSATDARSTHVVVEQTGKKWKAMQLYAAFILVLGVMVLAIGALPLVGAALVLIGLILFLWARVAAWWQHG